MSNVSRSDCPIRWPPRSTGICNDLKERAAAGLASGQPLTGDDWSLRPAELTLRQGRTLVAVPFREIDEVGLFDDKLCIWCKGQDEPAGAFAPGRETRPCSVVLLGEWVAHRQEAAAAQVPANGTAGPAAASPESSSLGKFLLERRKRKMAVYLGLAALIVFLPGC